MDFVDASAYLRQLSRRPGIARSGSLVLGFAHVLRKLL
jgi:hypothetical protein